MAACDMAFCSRRQLLVLLTLLVAFGGGVAVDRWRRARPDAVERLERFDREEERDTPAADAPPRDAPVRPSPDPGGPRPGPARPPKLRSDGAGGDRIELNRATADELTRLPGIGPALAARIIEAREREPFTAIDDLRRVRGVGATKLERVRPLVSVSAP